MGNRVQAKKHFHHILKGQPAPKRPYTETSYLPDLQKWFSPLSAVLLNFSILGSSLSCVPHVFFKIRIIRKVLSAWDSSSVAGLRLRFEGKRESVHYFALKAFSDLFPRWLLSCWGKLCEPQDTVIYRSREPRNVTVRGKSKSSQFQDLRIAIFNNG